MKAKRKGRSKKLYSVLDWPPGLYPREGEPVHIFTEEWVSPRAGLDGCGESRPHRDSMLDRAARSDSLYRYTMQFAIVKHHKLTFAEHL